MIVGLYGVSLCLLMPSVLSIGGFGELGESMSTYSQLSFSISICKRGGVWMCKLGIDVNTNADK